MFSVFVQPLMQVLIRIKQKKYMSSCIYSYGLLGPSGCGKTTLLSIIVGKTEMDSGDIMVKADKLENIGYMPQVRISV